MPRAPRLVAPGLPHHITQRGIRRKTTFFNFADYLAYLALVRKYQQVAQIDIWAYCLMPNHVHMVVVPHRENSLAKFFGPVHSQYAARVNAAHEWQGHLWQQRFYSAVMDERHALLAMRYVELNPVRAELCACPEEWRWSSARTNLGVEADGLVHTAVTSSLVDDWRSYLDEAIPSEMLESIRKHTRTGRPAGSAQFVRSLLDVDD
jgi:putative transposase